MTHEFVPNKKGLCKVYVGGSRCHLPEDATDHAHWRARYDNAGKEEPGREEDLLAEIARLRGALRSIAGESRLIAGNAEIQLVLTPEDMKE